MAGEAFQQAFSERYCLLAAMALIVHEYFLQLDNEVELFWKARLSSAKCIFLWNRYYSLLYSLAAASTFFIPNPSYNLCIKYHKFDQFGEAVLILSTQVVMEMRLYAMYGAHKFMKWLCIALSTAEIVWWIFIVSIRFQDYYANTDTNNPAPGLHMCAYGALRATYWSALSDVAVLLVECTILALALAKVWQQRRGNPLFLRLARESTMYFAIMFSVYVADLALYLVNRITLNQVSSGFRNVLPVILVNRLMISLREPASHTIDDTSIVCLTTNCLTIEATCASCSHLGAKSDGPELRQAASPDAVAVL